MSAKRQNYSENSQNSSNQKRHNSNLSSRWCLAHSQPAPSLLWATTKLQEEQNESSWLPHKSDALTQTSWAISLRVIDICVYNGISLKGEWCISESARYTASNCLQLRETIKLCSINASQMHKLRYSSSVIDHSDRFKHYFWSLL